jgi:hypothetical protein
VYAYVSNDPINFVDPEGLSRYNKNVPKQTKGGEEDVEVVTLPERRFGMTDINENLTPEKEFDLTKMVEKQINSEKTLGEKFTTYFKDNKEDLAIKAGAYIAVEGLKAIPIPVLGTALSKALDMALEKWQGDKKLMKEVEKQKNEFVAGSKSGKTKEGKAWQGFIQKALERSPGQDHFKDTMTKAMLHGRELAESHPPAVEQPLGSLRPDQERTKDRKVADASKAVSKRLEWIRRILRPHQMNSKKVHPI